MTQSILAFYSENIWSKDHSRNTQKTLHWLLQAIGSTAAVVGMIVEFVSRWQNGKFHFTTTHSVVGLIAGIFTLVGMLNGISALWSVELRKYACPVYFKLAHNSIGISAFVLGEFMPISICFWWKYIVWICFLLLYLNLGMVSLWFGYDKKFMEQNSREDIRMWLQALAIITIVLSLIGAVRANLCLMKTALVKCFLIKSWYFIITFPLLWLKYLQFIKLNSINWTFELIWTSNLVIHEFFNQ